jgi:hypothetical protein
MSIQHWVVGLISLIVLASFIFFAFNQGMRVRPRAKEHGAGMGGDIGSGVSVSLGCEGGGADGGGCDSGH